MSQDLLAEIAELKEAYASLFRDCGKLQKDADRMSWIERQNLRELVLCYATDSAHDGEIYVHGDGLGGAYGPTLRSAIDAAIAKEAK